MLGGQRRSMALDSGQSKLAFSKTFSQRAMGWVMIQGGFAGNASTRLKKGAKGNIENKEMFH